MEQYQKDFIDFIIESEALLFGEFTTKSGRKTPYFMNTGRFDDGVKLSRLAGFYAEHILRLNWQPDLIFGPAYKGIPLATAVATVLSLKHGKTMRFAFDRKEIKAHGDGGKFVGSPIRSGDKVVILEDVITAGTTLNEIVPLLRNTAKADVIGVVISVDRCEKGVTGELSATSRVEKELGIKVAPIVNIHQILRYCEEHGKISHSIAEASRDYLKQYGATNN